MTHEADMTSDSFGQYLQAIRTEKRISLETVSEETRIRLDTLRQIEAEDHENLPDEVFVKGFLRAYARAIGADGDEALRRYRIRLAVHRKVAHSEAALRRSGVKFWPRLLLSLGTLAVLIVISIFAISLIREQPASETETEPGEKAAEVRVEETQPVGTALPETKEEKTPPEKPSEKLLLRVNTIEETWLKIIIDDMLPKEYSLFPGDRIELEAGSGYNLLIGNAGGVELYLNDQPIKVPGKSGEVVNLELP